MANQKVNNFDNWMRNTVKSVHYSDNKSMLKAYEIIIESESKQKIK